MKYRKLGSTEISVSEIGFGTWGIGGATEGATSYGKTDDAESLRALAMALEKGITFYDTAGIYGHAEELLEKAFRGKRDKIVIATKVGLVTHNGPYDISPSYIRARLEESLKNLKTDYVDVFQLHSVPLELARATPACFETLKDLKKEGKIRSFGYSTANPADALLAIREFGAETVQVNFNMTDQRALSEGIFDAAREHGAGVITRTPFCYGFLTGAVTETKFLDSDHRSKRSPEQLARWKEASEIFSAADPEKCYTSAQLALKFCIAFPEVSAVIPGMLTAKEVLENAASSDLSPLTNKQLEIIGKVNRENKFFIGG